MTLPITNGTIRDSMGRFLPGSVGNPEGRPVGSVSLADKLRQRLSSHPEEADAIVSALVKLGMNSDLGAIKEMTDRIDGKVADKLQLTGTMLVATPDQLDLAMRLMLENKASETKFLNEGKPE